MSLSNIIKTFLESENDMAFFTYIMGKGRGSINLKKRLIKNDKNTFQKALKELNINISFDTDSEIGRDRIFAFIDLFARARAIIVLSDGSKYELTPKAQKFIEELEEFFVERGIRLWEVPLYLVELTRRERSHKL